MKKWQEQIFTLWWGSKLIHLGILIVSNNQNENIREARSYWDFNFNTAFSNTHGQICLETTFHHIYRFQETYIYLLKNWETNNFYKAVACYNLIIYFNQKSFGFGDALEDTLEVSWIISGSETWDPWWVTPTVAWLSL